MPWEFKSPHPHCLSRLIHTSAQEPQTRSCPSVTMGTRASPSHGSNGRALAGGASISDRRVPSRPGPGGLHEDQHPGQRVPMVTSALPKQPHHTTHWSVSSMADHGCPGMQAPAAGQCWTCYRKRSKVSPTAPSAAALGFKAWCLAFCVEARLTRMHRRTLQTGY